MEVGGKVNQKSLVSFSASGINSLLAEPLRLLGKWRRHKRLARGPSNFHTTLISISKVTFKDRDGQLSPSASLLRAPYGANNIS